MRPPSAGEVSAETVSVPLGGRRQVHLQQGELLEGRPGRPGKMFRRLQAIADLFPTTTSEGVMCPRKRRCCSKRSPRTSPLCFPHRLLLLFSVTPATETAAFKIHFFLFFFFLLLFEILCLAGHSDSESPVNVVVVVVVVCGAEAASERSAACC